MPRHDYRDPATGKFGKRTVNYPHASEQFPVVAERRTKRKTADSPAHGANHPDYPSRPDLVLTARQTLVGDDNSEVENATYETLPGPALPTTSVSRDTRGGTQTSITQHVLLADARLDALTYGQESSTVQAADCLQGIKTTVTREHPAIRGEIVNDQTLGTVGSVTVQTVAAGTPATAPDLTLLSSEQRPTDTAHSEKTDRRVAAWPTLTSRAVNARGDVETTVVAKVAPGTAPAADSLLTTHSGVSAETAARSEQATASVAAHSTLAGSELNARGEVVTISDDIVAPDAAVASDGLLVESDTISPQSATKARRVRKTVAARATLQTREHTKVGRNLTLTPAKFLGAETLTITKTLVDPNTAPDALSATVLSSVVEQTTVSKAEKTNVTRADAPYPTLAGSVFSEAAAGALASVTEQIVAPGTAAAAGFLVLSSEAQALSPDESLLRTAAVPSFPTLTAKKLAPAVPERFLAESALVTTTERVDTTAGVPEPDSGAGVLASQVEPENRFRARKVTTRLPAGATLPALTSAEMSNLAGGQSVPMVEEIVAPGTAAPTGFGVLAAKVTALSSTTSLQEVRRVSAFPLLAGSEAGRPAEVFPGKYGNGGGGGETFVEQIVPAGTTPAGVGVVLRREPVNQFEDRVRVGTRAAAGGVASLASETVNADGSTASVVYTLGGTSVATGYDVLASEVRPAGGGQVESVTRTQNGGFPPLTGARVAGPRIPAVFLAGVPLTVQRSKVAAGGGAGALGTGGGVLRSVVTPETLYRSQLETTALAEGAAFAQQTDTLAAAPHADGGTITRVRAIVDTASPGLPAPDFRTVELSLRDVGGGKGVRTVSTVDAYPLLTGTRVDEATGAPVTVQKQIVDGGTSLTPYSAGSLVFEELRPIDKYKSLHLRTSYALPAGHEDTEEISHRFPALFLNYQYINELGAFASVREAFTRIVTARVVYSWTATKQTPSFFAVTPVGWRFPQGFSFQDVLSDGGLYAGRQNGIAFSVEYPASTPTATAYLGLVGTEVLIGGYSRRVRPDMWKNKSVFIHLL